MQISDSRGKETVVTCEELSPSDREVYDTTIIYMTSTRICSRCRCAFSLLTSIGRNSSCTGRDHVDFDSEPADRCDAFLVPYNVYLALRTAAMWPSSEETARHTKPVPNSGRPVAMCIVRRSKGYVT